jgi:outer membrane protein assembly factor BamD
MKQLLATLMLGGLLVAAAGCGSTDLTTSPTAEDRFKHAKALFDNRDYLEAINEFTVVTLQYQGSAFASDAQFYLGESRYDRGEYLLAGFEYSVVKRNYPASPRVPDAQYKMAMSYYMLAPRSALDQKYTKKAIDEFQAFVEYYPSNEHAADADAKIKELTGRLARKEFETAQLYATMEYYKAATYYYNDVIERYHDTEFAPLSLLGKTELLISRSKYQDAKVEISRFLARYPNSVLRARGDQLKEKIDRELATSAGAKK